MVQKVTDAAMLKMAPFRLSALRHLSDSVSVFTNNVSSMHGSLIYVGVFLSSNTVNLPLLFESSSYISSFFFLCFILKRISYHSFSSSILSATFDLKHPTLA